MSTTNNSSCMHLKLIFFLFIHFQVSAQEVNDSVPNIIPVFPDVEVYSCLCSRDARFPGGHSALLAYINRSFRSPSQISIQNKPNRVYASFTVTVEGLIEDVKIERGIYPSIDLEIIHILEKMPVWIPQENGCQHIETRVLLPILITLI